MSDKGSASAGGQPVQNQHSSYGQRVARLRLERLEAPIGCSACRIERFVSQILVVRPQTSDLKRLPL